MDQKLRRVLLRAVTGRSAGERAILLFLLALALAATWSWLVDPVAAPLAGP